MGGSRGAIYQVEGRGGPKLWEVRPLMEGPAEVNMPHTDGDVQVVDSSAPQISLDSYRAMSAGLGDLCHENEPKQRCGHLHTERCDSKHVASYGW